MRILPVNLGDYASDVDWFGVIVFSPKGMMRECGSRNQKCDGRSQEMSSHKTCATLYLARREPKNLFGIGLVKFLFIGVADGQIVGDLHFFWNELVGIIHRIQHPIDTEH